MDIREQRRIGHEPKPKGQEPTKPTQEEIAAACLEIQKGWSEGERMRRRGISSVDGDAWNVPEVRSVEPE